MIASIAFPKHVTAPEGAPSGGGQQSWERISKLNVEYYFEASVPIIERD